jgi:hypothetical protein
MKYLGLLLAAVAAAVVMATAPISGATPPSARQHVHSSAVTWQVKHHRHLIAWHRSRTWNYQDQLGVGRTPTAYMERRTRSVPALRWVNRLWVHRQAHARHALAAHRLPYTGDWATAVRIVQRVWPGTADWLLSCSGGEGSHGGWVWNGGLPYTAGGPPTSYSGGYRTAPAGSSGAGGWMQFMLSTFTGSFRAAISEARARHLPVPVRAAWSWVSPLGQAFAAGRARFHHATGAWDPGIDPACA